MLENVRSQLFLCLMAIAGALVCILLLKPMYGPDLKGGTQLIYEVPEDVSVETPSQTEVVIKGTDKQRVGQVAAEIRRFRPPEPYKGKGVRYADERVVRKEAKKK